jgi:SAM-dependent methyltransferase
VVTALDEARRTSFDAHAELYDAVRPSYPDALAEAVLARAGTRVLELGAGTGKATLVFARRGATITALEPGGNLAALLRRNAAGLAVTVEELRFEAWPVEPRFDVVLAAQSIHWMDPATRYPRAAAALVPGGVLAIVRNEKAALAADLRDELDAAYARWLPPPDGPPLDLERLIADQVAEIDASGCFDPVDVARFPWTETYPTARYLELLATYSDHAVLPPARREPLFAAIAAALDRRGGVIEIPYVSLAFVTPRR